jgi:Uma2 family endonuclease
MSRVTLPELPLLPGADPEALYHIIHGQRVEFSKSAYASWIAGQVCYFLSPFVRERRSGRVFLGAHFVFDAEIDQRRRVDVAYVSADRWPIERCFPVTGDWIMVPNLAVEVLSPTDRFEQVLANVQEFFDHCVKQVWLVVPNLRELYVFDSLKQVRILGDGDTLDNTVVSGFSLKIGELFQ